MPTLIKPYPWIKRAGFPTITWISLINTASNPNADNSEREIDFPNVFNGSDRVRTLNVNSIQ